MEYGDTIESTVSPTHHSDTTRTPSLDEPEYLCDTSHSIYGDVSRKVAIRSSQT